MENIENGATQEPVVNTTQEPEVDYKVLYEKIQNDFAKVDKYNKDLKAKYQAKMTEEEQRKAELEEKENYYKNLEKELSKSKTKSLLKDVKDEKLNDTIADKFASGDYFNGLKELTKYYEQHIENSKKQWQEEMLMKNPIPPASNTENQSVISKSQFEKMTYNERVKFKTENPELYVKYTK